MAKINKREKAALQKLNQSANRKKANIRKNYNMMVDIEVKTLKELQGMNRDQLNAYKEELKSFTNRYNLNYQYVKNEEGEVIGTKKEVQAFERGKALANRQKKAREQRLKKTKFTVGGKDTGISAYDYGIIGDPDRRENQLKADPKKLDRETFQEWLEKLDGGKYMDSLNEQWRENYITGLENVFGSQAWKIIGHINKMDIKDFIKMAEGEKFASIEYIYDPAEMGIRMNKIAETWGI